MASQKASRIRRGKKKVEQPVLWLSHPDTALSGFILSQRFCGFSRISLGGVENKELKGQVCRFGATSSKRRSSPLESLQITVTNTKGVPFVEDILLGWFQTEANSPIWPNSGGSPYFKTPPCQNARTEHSLCQNYQLLESRAPLDRGPLIELVVVLSLFFKHHD